MIQNIKKAFPAGVLAVSLLALMILVACSSDTTEPAPHRAAGCRADNSSGSYCRSGRRCTHCGANSRTRTSNRCNHHEHHRRLGTQYRRRQGQCGQPASRRR